MFTERKHKEKQRGGRLADLPGAALESVKQYIRGCSNFELFWWLSNTFQHSGSRAIDICCTLLARIVRRRSILAHEDHFQRNFWIESRSVVLQMTKGDLEIRDRPTGKTKLMSAGKVWYALVLGLPQFGHDLGSQRKRIVLFLPLRLPVARDSIAQVLVEGVDVLQLS